MMHLVERRTIQILLVLQVVLCDACSKSDPASNLMTNEFQKALDPKADVVERMNSASTLPEEKRVQLRSKLTSELPGSWNKATLDAIQVLGEVGNDDTIEELEKVDKMPNEATGVFHAAILDAIAKIKKRELINATIPQALRRK